MRHASTCWAVVAVAGCLVASALAAGPIEPSNKYPIDDNIYMTSNYPGRDFAKDSYLVWKGQIGGSNPTQISAPTMNSDGSRVYVTDQTNHLYCLSTSHEGELIYDFRFSTKGAFVLWSFLGDVSGNNQPQAFQPALSMDESTLYYSTADHVYAVDATSGSMKWVMPYNDISSPIFAFDEYIVFGTGSTAEIVYAFAANGTFYVKFDSSSFPKGPTSAMRSRAVADPASHLLYMTSMDTSVYALDIGIPKPAVKFSTVVDSGHSIRSAPVLDVTGKRLFITSVLVGADPGVGGSLHSVPTTGAWFNPPKSTELFRVNSTITSSPVLISESRVAFGDANGNVYCINVNTTRSAERVVWKKKLGNDLVATPITDGDTIIIASNAGNPATGTLHALDAKTGEELWTFQAAAQLLTEPLPSGDGSIVFADSKGVVYALSPAGGKSAIVTYIVFAVLLVAGLLTCTVGYRLFRITLSFVSLLAIFFAVVTCVELATNGTRAVWEAPTIGGGVAIAVAAFMTFYPKAGPTFWALAFVVFTANDLLIAMSKTYGDLGWKIIVGECVALVLFGIISLAKGGKKFMCLLGTAAVGATFVVGAVASFLPDFKDLYVGIGYAVVFVFSVLLQAGWTGREDFHLPKEQRTAAGDEDVEAGKGKPEDYTRLDAGSPPTGRAGGEGPLGSVRRPSDSAFGADDRFRGDEFNMGMDMGGSAGVAVLPGQRAATHFSAGAATNVTGADDRGQLITARFVAGKMGLRLSPFHDLGGASPAIVRSVTGQARAQGVMGGDFVVAVGRLSINPAMHYEDVMGAIQAESRPLEIQFLRPYSRSLDLEGEVREGGGGMFGGW